MSDLYSEITKAIQPEYKKNKKDADKNTEKINNLLNKLDKLACLAGHEELSELKNFLGEIRSGDAEPNQLYTEKEIENELVDEGSPLESGRYDDMTYAQMVAAALQSENEATEIALALIEKTDNENDIKKFVEIANDENDHSLVYQGILNRLNNLSE